MLFPKTACFALVLPLAACSSSSSATATDAGFDSFVAHRDAGDDAEGSKTHDAEVKRDAALVCTPGFIHFDAGVDAAKSEDAKADGADKDGEAPPGHPDAKAEDAAKKDAAKEDAGDAGVDAMPPTCQQLCATNNPGAYVSFREYQLGQCGCLMNGPCYAACGSATTLDGGAPCGSCLASQLEEDLESTCTLAAAMQCANDPKCSAFQSCYGACP